MGKEEANKTAEAPVPAGESGITVNLKTGTIIAILGGILGTGGGAGVIQLLSRPSPEVVQRLDAIEARQTELEKQLGQQEALHKETNELAQRIHRLILRAHAVETTIDGKPIKDP